MRDYKQVEVISVSVSKFKSLNGDIHNTREQAELKNKFYLGIAKDCPNSMCTLGKVPTDDFRSSRLCNTCKGKGYVEKQEVWK